MKLNFQVHNLLFSFLESLKRLIIPLSSSVATLEATTVIVIKIANTIKPGAYKSKVEDEEIFKSSYFSSISGIV